MEVSWTYPTLNAFAVSYVILYRGITPLFESANEIVRQSGSRYFDRISHGEYRRYYYWIRLVSINGTEGAVIGPVDAEPIDSVEEILAGITGRIDHGVLAESLKTRVDSVLLLQQELAVEKKDRTVSEQAMAAALADVQSYVDNSISQLNDVNQSVLFDSATGLVNKVAGLTTNFSYLDSNVGAVRDRASRIETTLYEDANGLLVTSDATAQAALATIVKLASTGDTVRDAKTRIAAVENTITTVSNSLKSETDARLLMAAKYDASLAAINVQLKASADASGSFTSYLQSMGADFSNGAVAAMQASLAIEQTARSSADDAIVTDLRTLSSTVNDPDTGLAKTRSQLINDYYTKTDTKNAIASAGETLTTSYTSADAATLSSAKGYADGVGTATLTSAKSYVEGYAYSKSDADGALSQEITRVTSTFTNLSESAAEGALASLLENEKAANAARDARTRVAVVEQSISSLATDFKAEVDTRTQAATVVGNQMAAFDSSLKLQSTKLDAFGTKIDSLGATVDAGKEQTRALIENESTVRADAIDAKASQVLTLTAGTLASVDASEGLLSNLLQAERASNTARDLKARVAIAEQAITTATTDLKAEATSRLLLATRMDGTEATLVNLQGTVSTLKEATAYQSELLVAQVNQANDFTRALVQEEKTARATATNALATQVQTVQTVLDGNVATGQVGLTAKVETIDGKVTSLGAQYTAKLDVNGLIGGFSIYNDGTEVEAGFDLDKFWIGRSTNKVKPFVMEGDTVYMNKAMIHQLTADQIDSKGLDLRKADGTVILSANTPLTSSYITPASGWLNSNVTLGSSGILYGAGGGQVTLPGMGLNSYRIVCAGFSGVAPAALGLYINGNWAYGVARSYTFARIRRSDGVVTYIGYYDVYGTTGHAAALAWALNNTGSDSLAVVWTYDEPQNNRLSNGLEAAMYRCGASRAVFGSPNFKGRSAYVLVGIGGCGEGNGAEIYAGSYDDAPDAWIDMGFQLKDGTLVGVTSSTTPKTLADYGYTGAMDATKGATFGVNIGGQITSANAATYLGEQAIADVYISSVSASKIVTASLSAISANIGTVTAGILYNTGYTSYVNLNASGNAAFLNANGKAIIRADGSAYFEGPVISRNQITASGNYTTGGEGTFLINTWIPITDWSDGYNPYVAMAGTYGLVNTYTGIDTSTVKWGVVCELIPYTAWNGGSYLHIRATVYSQNVSGYGGGFGISWKVYKVT